MCRPLSIRGSGTQIHVYGRGLGGLLFGCDADADAGDEPLEHGEGDVLADAERQHQSVPLPVFREIRDAPGDRVAGRARPVQCAGQ